ncbi:uncharacterized protein PG986_013690 [Apiospora aurea]|uniref:CFEM domain-containing protein n=1 Tax=Apiospora aurea TaxID=335848 RepID=A0ABR1PWM4_9PEZI
MHFNAAFIALLAAAAGVNASTLEDRNLGPPQCAELCFKKAIESSQCQNQKHYIRTLWLKKANWECLCKDQQFHGSVVPCIEQRCKKPKDLQLVNGFLGKSCGYSVQSSSGYQQPTQQPQPYEQPSSKSQYKARNYNPQPYQAPKDEYKSEAPKEQYQPKKQESYQQPKEYAPKKPEHYEQPAKGEYKPVEQPKQKYKPVKGPESYQAPKKQEGYQPKQGEYKPKKQDQYQQQAPKKNY